MKPHAEFDQFAKDYDRHLSWLRLTGENKDYYASGRVQWLSRALAALGVTPRLVMDFGCGTGGSVAPLFDLLGSESVVGVDVSPASLDVARATHPTRGTFLHVDNYEPQGTLDLIHTSCAFHHIPPSEREGAATYLYRALRDGGVLAFWENNPWNPIVRFAMAHAAIDRNAVPINPRAAQRLLRSVGFKVLYTDFAFFFPRALQILRGLESGMAFVPLGAQYCVFARKPSVSASQGM
ncbi:MAG: class I SAM-dependent methyltransferase [Nitrospirota bacterium]